MTCDRRIAEFPEPAYAWTCKDCGETIEVWTVRQLDDAECPACGPAPEGTTKLQAALAKHLELSERAQDATDDDEADRLNREAAASLPMLKDVAYVADDGCVYVGDQRVPTNKIRHLSLWLYDLTEPAQ